MHNLEQLLIRDNYIRLIQDIVKGRAYVDEYDDWLKHVDRKTLEQALTTIADILWKQHSDIVYPQEIIVVPRYPFSKTPMITWSGL